MLQRMRASEEEDASKLEKMRASVVMRVDDAIRMICAAEDASGDGRTRRGCLYERTC